MPRLRYLLVALAAGLAACHSASAAPAPSSSGAAACATPERLTTVPYRSIPGVPVNQVSLDIHAPAGQVCGAPVVMWVHGGSYQDGDKANQMTDKVSFFNTKGWILVSVNYRLTVAGDPSSAHYPSHYEDVAGAVTWVHDNIGGYGGDPARLAVLGHSAGADIVSNVADNPGYLQAGGLTPAAIRCAGTLDTEGFDKTSAESAEQAQWQEALGNDPGYATDTSATLLAAKGTGIPPTIGVYRGTAVRQRIERAYLAKLQSLGVPTTLIDARSLTHQEVNSSIGAADDTVMTPPLNTFLEGCFSS